VRWLIFGLLCQANAGEAKSSADSSSLTLAYDHQILRGGSLSVVRISGVRQLIESKSRLTFRRFFNTRFIKAQVKFDYP
jgi:hypothetical protein